MHLAKPCFHHVSYSRSTIRSGTGSGQPTKAPDRSGSAIYWLTSDISQVGVGIGQAFQSFLSDSGLDHVQGTQAVQVL